MPPTYVYAKFFSYFEPYHVKKKKKTVSRVQNRICFAKFNRPKSDRKSAIAKLFSSANIQASIISSPISSAIALFAHLHDNSAKPAKRGGRGLRRSVEWKRKRWLSLFWQTTRCNVQRPRRSDRAFHWRKRDSRVYINPAAVFTLAEARSVWPYVKITVA